MRTQPRRFRNAEKQVTRLLTFVFLLLLGARQSEAQTQTQISELGNPASHRRKLVVSIPHRKLALVEDGSVKRVYTVAVGAVASPSPTGSFEVKTRLVRPTYYHPGKVIPAGSDNPLGTRWIGLNTQGYGIHGTNVESSVGKAVSHGCIRMHREDLEELFAAVQLGDRVEIRDEADPELASIFGEVPGSGTATEDSPAAFATGQ